MNQWRHILRLVEGWEHAEPGKPNGDEGCLVWGITAEMPSQPGWPSAAVVKEVNSKLFSHAVASELGIELPGVAVCRSIEELDDHATNKVLVKHPLGVSGRERIELRGPLDQRQRGWALNALAETPLLVEPNVSIHREWSLQFELGSKPAFLGSAALLVDGRGQHRGHIVGLAQPGADVIDAATDAAQRVFDRGYRGPLGIDAFEGTLMGQVIVRPVSEINARMTFGRLALELARRVGQPCAWWIPGKRELTQLRRRPNSALRALPEFADPDGLSGSFVIVDSVEILRIFKERHSL